MSEIHLLQQYRVNLIIVKLICLLYRNTLNKKKQNQVAFVIHGDVHTPMRMTCVLILIPDGRTPPSSRSRLANDICPVRVRSTFSWLSSIISVTVFLGVTFGISGGGVGTSISLLTPLGNMLMDVVVLVVEVRLFAVKTGGTGIITDGVAGSQVSYSISTCSYIVLYK